MKTHHCAELTKTNIGQTITLAGWVNRRRDHGGLIFIDLRDHGGITQLVFDPRVNEAVHSKAHSLRSEWVIQIKGEVIPRAEGMTNPKMKTGEIEIKVDYLNILSEAQTPPFSICEEEEVREELTLKYRYLDMRRGPLLENLKARHKTTQCIRNFLDDREFYEVSTPILSKSTPEGARDYLVPSRIHPNSFYALPQSPQVFKQILMVSGLNRYFQICPCFRDEDLRADRQPEFSQLDLEMSFESTDTLFELIEELMEKICKTHKRPLPKKPFLRMSYPECMELYGTDKPDLRIPLTLLTIDDLAKESEFSVFKDQCASGGTVKGMKVPQGSDISRRKIDEYTQFVSQFGIKGLAFMKFQNGALSSSIVKFFSEEQQSELIKRFELQEGDLIFFVADRLDRVNQALDHLRRALGKERGLIAKEDALLWVVDFPLFMRSDEGELESSHHPFTAPHCEDIELIDQDPTRVRSLSYDLVWNGYEIASGSQRIHDPKLQKKIFESLRLSKHDIEQKFGSFVNALSYGTPPHLGIALGLDRIMMILLETDNIKDVIAFPKTQKAADLMLNSPSKVEDSQLKELHIELIN